MRARGAMESPIATSLRHSSFEHPDLASTRFGLPSPARRVAWAASRQSTALLLDVVIVRWYLVRRGTLALRAHAMHRRYVLMRQAHTYQDRPRK